MYREHNLAKPRVRGIMLSVSNLYTENLPAERKGHQGRSSLGRKEP
jgi:hypothetical protein